MDILIIEDEENARIGLVFLLASMGHGVDQAADAAQAIEKMTVKCYGLVILDIMLPPGAALRDVPFRETGKELLLRLREEKLGKLQTPRDVPVVAVTAVSDIDVIEKINSAANLVIYKPVDPDDAVTRMVDAGLLQRSAT